MTTGKDTASFFENGTTEQFEYCYTIYPKVLEMKAEKRSKKPQELIRLDQWYQNELPKLIKTRGKDAHMVYDELVQTMKWKQSRGKFYPQLSYLVKVNTPRAVMQETKKAFRKLPNLEQAITALSNLKGVGTTMASALLAAAAPNSAPFMADECLMAIPEIEGIDYTTKEYLNFVQHIQTTVARLNTEAGGETPFWSPHRVELALWAHYVANDLSPEMLDDMPGPGAGGGVNTNGKAMIANDILVDGTADDTNDGESLGAVAQRESNHNTATESETDNDSNNPARNLLSSVCANQGVSNDGDSNFVSNDSTSHEPIIDENTTQTTATTSTDDCEVATTTPLASDSESNIELPVKIKNGTTSVAHVAAETADVAVESDIVTATEALTSLPEIDNNKNSTIIAPTTNNSKGDKFTTNTAPPTDATDALIGNGNGTLMASTGDACLHSVDTVIDNESRRCMLPLPNADASECTEEHKIADEGSNSNSGGGSHKTLTPIINDDTISTAINDSTLLNTVGKAIVGQKRALGVHCDVVPDDGHIQPDTKKLRSD